MPQPKSPLSPGFCGSRYTEDEVEFIKAMERHIFKTKNKYPTYKEVLQVAKSLGWKKDETNTPNEVRLNADNV